MESTQVIIVIIKSLILFPVYIYKLPSSYCFIYYDQILFRGNPSNHQRYRRLTLFAYGFPTIVVTLTIIAEVTLSSCDPYKPRIGELSKCGFSGNILILNFLLAMQVFKKAIMIQHQSILFSNFTFQKRLLSLFGFCCHRFSCSPLMEFCLLVLQSFFSIWTKKGQNLI